MRGIILQQAGKDFLPLLDFGAKHWGTYASRYKLDYWALRNDLVHPFNWNWDRVILFQHCLNMGYDLMVWADVDTIIVDHDADIRNVLTTGQVGMCWHDIEFVHWQGHYNNGLMVMKGSQRTSEFIQAVYALAPNGAGHDQGAINHMLRDDPRFMDLLERLDDKWNSTARANDCGERAVVRSWHGTGDAAYRLEQMQKAIYNHKAKLEK